VCVCVCGGGGEHPPPLVARDRGLKRSKTDRRMETAEWVWLCPPPLFSMALWLLHSHTLYCASVLLTDSPPFGFTGMLFFLFFFRVRVAHTALIGRLHRCFSLSAPSSISPQCGSRAVDREPGLVGFVHFCKQLHGSSKTRRNWKNMHK